MRLLATVLVFGFACGESHTVDGSDGGPDATRDAGRTDAGGADAAVMCRGFPAPCHPELGGGCCGAPVMPECRGGAWLCPAGSVGPESCRSFEPCGMVRCTGFGEIECLNVPGCTPIYDDSCCPSCDPVGFCADCTDLEYERCDPVDVACEGRGCGLVPRWVCGGARPECSDASPVGEGAHCSVPGCVKVSEPGCVGDECEFCEPATPGMCTALCPALPPDCGPGRFPQADGMCFTGLCVYAELCAPPEG